MYAHVKLINGYHQILTYNLPEELQKCPIGSLVKVPLRNKYVVGFITKKFEQLPESAKYAIKSVICQEDFPQDPFYFDYLNQLASYYQTDIAYFVKRIKQFIKEQKNISEEVILAESNRNNDNAISLTAEQEVVTNFISNQLDKPLYCPILLQGVTGSGKTEVYKKAILQALRQNKSIVLMLPEVSLAIAFEHLLRAQLPSDIAIFGFHSASSAKDKKILWQSLQQQKACLIIGVHLPILLPLPHVGLIIIDEEHELSYHEKKHPKINSKEAALLRAYHAKIPILLGSATPSISSLYAVKTRNWHYFSLKNRYKGAFPEIKLVNLKSEPQRKNFWISGILEKALKDRLEKKEQSIIFINRRGFSFFVQCTKCTFIFACSSCSVSLTLHEGDILTCHYCGHHQKIPQNCPSCKNSAAHFLKKGIGTQQVVSILQHLFPSAKIARADLDTTTKKKLWQNTISAFKAGHLDILVGTQTLTKGYHFPKVTLVGLLWADINLNFPFYYAQEMTLQQIIQVAGRAGREYDQSQVIIQSMVDHPIFNFVNEQDYQSFYEFEIQKREMVGYPPIMRLAEIELKHTHEEILDKESMKIAHYLQDLIEKKAMEVTILGPAKPPVYKIKNTHSRKIYLKAKEFKLLVSLFQSIDQKQFSISIFFTPNPI